MEDTVDDQFYERADVFINLANGQLSDMAKGKVSASFMYALARFNAWVSAGGFATGEQMKQSKQATIDYFVTQYKAMLEENLNDYIEHFERYRQ